MERNKNKLVWWKKLLIGVGGFFGSLIVTVFTVIGGLNILKFAIYPEYYSIRTLVCHNSGTHSDYMTQGTAISDDGKYIITSGYMKDNTNSRIYITEIETNIATSCMLLPADEGPSKGKEVNRMHFGGVAIKGDTIYVASDDSVHTVSLKEALVNDELKMNYLMSVNSQASFIDCDEQYLYVGEFYDLEHNYKTNNKITYNNKEYNAIVEKYSFDDLETCLEVYAIRDEVQGFAVNDKGDMLLSCSYGLASSYFYFYNKDSIVNTNTTYEKADNAPLYILENHDKTLIGPAMAEDLDYYDGKFYTNFESASNKYIFGKFFVSADKIVALDFSKYETK